MKKTGIQYIPGKLTNIQCLDDDNNEGKHIVTCTTTTRNEEVSIQGDLLILATGRKPCVKNIGLESIGIDINELTNGIEVDDNLETNIKGVYAAGDCTGDQQFTHYAGYQGAIAARNILLPFNDPIGKLTTTIPASTFTSPEVASIGYTEEEAVEEYGGASNIKVIYKSLENDDRAVCESTTRGFLKIITNKNDNIVGATIVSPVAGEMISEIAVAINSKKSLSDLATVMHPYPSYSFAFQVIGADLYYEKLGKYKWILNFLKFLGL